MWAACGGPRPEAEPSKSADGPVTARDSASLTAVLAESIQVQVARDSVLFVLHVTNPTAEAIQLDFSSAQRFDFEVRRADGTEVWRWSADRTFAQVVGKERVAPGETLRYEAVWRPGASTGSFTVIGQVVTLPRVLEQRADFEIQSK
jgi:hypothetical protein